MSQAARALGRSRQYLYDVLSGKKISAALLRKIEELPKNPEKKSTRGFAATGILSRHQSRHAGGSDGATICEQKDFTLRAAAAAIGVNFRTLRDHLSGTSRSAVIEAKLNALPDLTGTGITYGRAGRAHAIELGKQAIAKAGL
jgi:hypothetical protein